MEEVCDGDARFAVVRVLVMMGDAAAAAAAGEVVKGMGRVGSVLSRLLIFGGHECTGIAVRSRRKEEDGGKRERRGKMTTGRDGGDEGDRDKAASYGFQIYS